MNGLYVLDLLITFKPYFRSVSFWNLFLYVMIVLALLPLVFIYTFVVLVLALTVFLTGL